MNMEFGATCPHVVNLPIFNRDYMISGYTDKYLGNERYCANGIHRCPYQKKVIYKSSTTNDVLPEEQEIYMTRKEMLNNS
jgi:hypothetical protein